MEYRQVSLPEILALKKLYDNAGWQTYLKDPALFEQMFENSLFVLGAYKDEALVGSIRVVGDNAHILYIQDILVHSDHRRKGIGKNLLKQIVDRYTHVRQKVLITDADDDGANLFYENCGFKKAETMNVTCYLKFD